MSEPVPVTMSASLTLGLVEAFEERIAVLHAVIADREARIRSLEDDLSRAIAERDRSALPVLDNASALPEERSR